MANLQKPRTGSLSQAPEEQELAAVEDDAEEHPRRKPTISKYVMDKVWLNAATLGLMFKSEANSSSSSSFNAFCTNVFMLCAEAPSLLSLAYRCTNRHKYPPTSRRRAI